MFNKKLFQKEIREFRQYLSGSPHTLMIRNGCEKLYCSILQKFVTLERDKWNSATRAIEIGWNILCEAGKYETTVANIVDRMFHLLHIFNENKNWLTIQEAYHQHHSKPSWETMIKFITTINSEHDLNRIINELAQATEKETMAKTVLDLACLISTDDELILLNKYRTMIEGLSSTTSSIVELLEQIQRTVPQEIQEKIHAYLIIARLPILNTLDEEQRYQILDSIVPNWQILFNVIGRELRELFDVVSSTISSFYGLVINHQNPFNQALYTISMTSALCTLAHYRQRTREWFTNDAPISQSISSSSILDIIQHRLKIVSPTSSPAIDQSQISFPSTSKPRSNTVTSSSRDTNSKSTYTDETLQTMTKSVRKYTEKPPHTSINFTESDSVHSIIKAAQNYRSQVTQWYGAFTTFNVLAHHRLNINDSIYIKTGHDIIHHGLHLLRDLVVVQKLLEPTFTRTALRFIIKDLHRLEKCFLSLSLENYSQLREILRILHVDVSRIKNDFLTPSKLLAPKGSLSSGWKQFEMTQMDSLTVRKDSNAATTIATNEPSTSIQNDDTPMTIDDWRQTIQNDDARRWEDTLKLAAYKKSNQSKISTKYRKSTTRIQTSVRNLAQEKTAQNATNAQIATASDNISGSHNGSYDIDTPVKFDIDQQIKAMQANLSQHSNLIEMYEKVITNAQKVVPDGKLVNRTVLTMNKKPDRWSYQLLVEIPSIARMINIIIEQYRSNWEQLINSIDLHEQHEIRWCILIDNSGSMSIYRNALYEILVILMELLRKLENQFAVVRFGGRNNQRPLKNLTDRFTIQEGQYVLEALTFDEGTYPASGLDNAANHVFGVATNQNRSSVPIVHRHVLMITDGLTHDKDDTTYTATINKYDLNLGVLFIETVGQSSSQILLHGLKQAQHRIVHANNIDQLPSILAQLMHDMVKISLKTDNPQAPVIAIPEIKIRIPTVPDNVSDIELNLNKSNYEATNPTSYIISSPTAAIPRLKQASIQLTNYLSLTKTYTDYTSTAFEKLRQYYQTLKFSSTMQDIEKNWIADEYCLAASIDDVSTVLGDLVFPCNKFTRRRAALRGSSLYLPGLIKAMTSEWTYKKIFSAKLAGGKRDHAVCLVLDVSTSMLGTLSAGLYDSIVVLTAALRKLDLDKFGIVVFGRDVRLIKSPEQMWDAASIFTLVCELRFDLDEDTKDADAIEVAIDLLGQCATRGEKKIFIITDGYTNYGNRLAMVQQRAENNGIDLVAIATGIDHTNLESVYKRYVQCATVRGLSKALRALFEQESQIHSTDWAPIKADNTINMQQDPSTMDRIFQEIQSKKIFDDMIKELASERDATLINSGQPISNITIDICFCLDCTGSMSRWLAAAKGQMNFIMNDISKLITEKFPSLKLQLRFAVVGFRDVKDQSPIMTKDFTDKMDDIMTFVNGLTATGGGDLPEDVLGALNACLALKWSKTNARFIVLITDAPGHGPELNDNLTIDHYPNGVESHTVSSIFNRLLKKDAEIDLMFCIIKPEATARMQNVFQKFYDTKGKDSGRVFTAINLFDDQQRESQMFHFVFVLDESGSMQQHWKDLLQAYNTFLTRRNNDQGGDDVVSVIQFATEARKIFSKEILAKAPRDLTIHGGGTDYVAGLKEAEIAIHNDTTKSSVVMIFMSDGADCSKKQPDKIISELKQKFDKNHNFICHTVGFGTDIKKNSDEEKLLKTMAINGGGQMYSAENGAALSQVFGKIAANSTTSSALVDRFAEILTRDITNKIVVDYL